MSRFVKLGNTYFRADEVRVITTIAERSSYSRITLVNGEVWTIAMAPDKVAEALTEPSRP